MGVLKMKTSRIGELAFLAFVLIAILAGLATYVTGAANGAITAVLVVLGIIVGLLNVSEKETTPFLVASIALLAAANIGAFVSLGNIGMVIDNILKYIGAFVAPAAVIVALKAVYALGAKK
jgi:hypothetical protein